MRRLLARRSNCRRSTSARRGPLLEGQERGKERTQEWARDGSAGGYGGAGPAQDPYNQSYSYENASVGTKTDTPVMETPLERGNRSLSKC